MDTTTSPRLTDEQQAEFLELTPQEADALALRLVEIVQELRARPEPTRGADRTLVSISVLPWFGNDSAG